MACLAVQAAAPGARAPTAAMTTGREGGVAGGGLSARRKRRTIGADVKRF
jgi:hypothetical protein